MVYNKLVSILFAMVMLSLPLPTFASDDDDDDIDLSDLELKVAAMQTELNSIKESIAKSDVKSTSQKSNSPTLYGTVMARYDLSLYDGDSRFVIRNTRFGFKGVVSDDLRYVVQVDFSNSGSITLLDAYLGYSRGSFDLVFGQQHNYVTTDIQRGPNSNFFTTRSYGAVFSLAYYDGESVSIGSRDIGAYLTYKFNLGSIPVKVGTGAFNGSGANKPEWNDHLNWSSRVMIGGSEGVSGEFSLYRGEGSTGLDFNIWSGMLRYSKRNLFVESAYQQRRVQSEELEILQVGLLQGYYKVPTTKSRLFDYIAPTLRWDMGHNLDYVIVDSSGSGVGYEQVNASRATVSLNFGLKGEALRSRFSIGYERVFMGERPVDIAYNPLLQDKLVIGFTGSF